MDQRSARLRATAAAAEPLLDVDDIQGNILAGFNKDHQTLIALRIDVPVDAKRWLRRVEPCVSTTAEVLAFNDLFRRLRSRRRQDPQGLAATWINIAFSAAGLRKLVPPEDVEAIPDEAFRVGMLERAEAILHDPATPGARGAPDTWKVGGPGHEPDILLVVAGDVREEMERAVQWLLSPDGDEVVPEVLYQEYGHTRPDLPGHEHFGFKDGISQPAVRGRISENPDVLLEPRLLDPSSPDADTMSRPGQPLLWPGLFVFGYPTQTRDDGTPFDPGPVMPEWLRNGSFLVFRRLLQDVAGFRKFVDDEAALIAQQPQFSWVTRPLLEALFVGRWPSGVPVVRAPLSDPGSTDAIADNHFLWETAVPPVQLRPETGRTAPISGAPGDLGGRLCPHAAHVRKVNPRDQDTELGDAFDTLTRRILRRGIPFGPPLPDPAPADDIAERGLLFLCYQRSIVDQFEVNQQNWANNPETPKPGGHDPIIGQSTEATGRQRTFEFKMRGAGPARQVAISNEFVITSGGGYFFAPSLTALRERLSADAS